jgi:alpha-glucosidase
MLALPGSAYLYQGEELGLPEVDDLPVSKLEDPIWARSGQTRKGRDGCRVPLPWTTSGSSFGFGADGTWLPQPSNWGRLSVETQDGTPGSTLEFYREAIRLRKAHMKDTEAFEWVETSDDLMVFDRGKVRIIVNFGDTPLRLTPGEVLLATSATDGGFLPAEAAAWVRRD